MTKKSGELIVVALGGNALVRRDQKGTYEEQQENVAKTSSRLADLIESSFRLVITHGNGPQVGATLLRHEAGQELRGVPPLPMFVCVAETQGFVGYMIQQALRSEFKRRRLNDQIVLTIITRVIVEKDDPDLLEPSKPIGPFYSEEGRKEARRIHPDWAFAEDRSRGGWRRIVPSPDPKRIAIAEQSSIRSLVDAGFTVVACGGGGIPTVEEEGWKARGIEAVIDKDLAGERLATLIGAARLVMLTDVDAAYLNFGKENQTRLCRVALKEAKQYLEEGQFREGSMEPKIAAAVRFMEAGGKEAIIADLFQVTDAVSGLSGTHIVK